MAGSVRGEIPSVTGRFICGAIALWIASAPVTPVASAQDTAGRLSLGDCIELALERNDQLAQAEANARIVRGGYIGAWANLLPNVSAEASKSQSASRQSLVLLAGQWFPGPATGTTVTTYGIAARVDQSILNLERYYAWREQRESWGSAQAGFLATQQDVTLDVIARFYAVVTNERLAALQREALALSQDRLRKTEALFELGAVPKADVLNSRVDVSRSQRDLVDAENALVISKGRLNLVIGNEIADAIEVAYEPAEVPDPLPLAEDVQELARRQRPDVRQAARDVEVGRMAKRSAFWSGMPSISGSVFYNKGFPEAKVAYDFESMHDIKNESSWGYWLGLSVPIFDGLVTKGKRVRADAGLHAAQEALDEKERLVDLEVREAVLNMKTARAGLELADEEIVSAEENLRLREAMYDHGAATILELIEAQVDLTNARYNSIISETQLQYAWKQFLRATGTNLATGQPF
jgi:outer membrane protein TolC